MWKRKLPSGKYQYGQSYVDPMTGKKKQATITLESGSKRAERLAQEQINQKIAQQIADTGKPEDITLSELCRRRVEYQMKHDKEQTAVTNRCHLNTLERVIGGDVRVSSLNAPYVEQRLSSNPTTHNEELTRFKALMRWAYRADYVKDISYLDKLQRMKEPSVKEKDKDKYLEHEAHSDN